MTLALVIGCGSLWKTSTYASTGRIWFDDPETAVGDEITIGATAKDAGGNAIGSVNVTMEYDTDYLRFEDGENATGSDGTVTLAASGDGSSDTVEFKMKFQALQEGTTVVEIISCTATTSSGETLTLTEGQSTVTIAEGDPSKIKEESTTDTDTTGIEVEMDGTKYTLSAAFSEDSIPTGFEEDELTINGSTCKAVKNSADVYLGYLIDSEGNGDFYLYDADSNSFSAFQQIKISEGATEGNYIILLQDDGTLNIPEDTYKKTTLTVNEKEYPTWQNIAKPAYYLLYAIGFDGTKRLYQYDSGEATYQRFDLDDTSSQLSGVLGVIQDFVENHFMAALIAVAVVVGLLLLIWLINAIKIHSRNKELDELYEEFGLYEDEEEEPVVEKKSKKEKKQEKAAAKNSKKAAKQEKAVKQEKPAKQSKKKTVVDDFDDFSEFEGEYDDFDFDDEPKKTSAPKKREPKRASLDDDFDIDFLDLDL
jgi:hypothetical protein